MIFSEGVTYNEGYRRLKERRDCVNPNLTFITQLQWFYKRLYEPNFNSLPVLPRVYSLISHQIEDPHRVVAKLLLENLYQNKATSKVLDPRGMFIVVR